MIIIDLEFTGLDPERHGIVSLAAMDFENPKRVIYLECKPRPGAEFDAEASEVHGFTKEYTDKLSLSEKELVQQFHEFALKCEKKVLAAQVPQMDVEFLRRAYERYELDWIFGHRYIDLFSICFAHLIHSGLPVPYKYNVPDLSLDTIARYCGLAVRPGKHNALEDVKITAECLSRLLHGKNLLLEFEKQGVPKFSINKKFGQMH